MGGGVSSLPAEVTLAEAKELAGAKWQPEWEEKFEAAADAKISKDEAVRCWTEASMLDERLHHRESAMEEGRREGGLDRANARRRRSRAKGRLSEQLYESCTASTAPALPRRWIFRP